jgi:hypothetical protein
MPKSSHFQPGDSAPDFSHLADHDSESDEPQWQPGGDAPAPTAGADEDLSAEDRAREFSHRGDEAADPTEPTGDSHVFFEADEPVGDDELAGETTAYAPPHQRSAPVANDTPRAALHDELDADSVLDAAPNADDPALRVSTDNATQLTDVGIPVFVDPPGVGDPPVDDEPPDSSTLASDDAPAAERPAVETTPRAETPPEEEFPAAVAAPSAAPTPRTVSRPQRSAATPASAATADRQRLLLILLASYASAMTIAFLWLWMARNTARPHELESLPDVAPLGPNEFRYAPQNASMPAGHTLPLGAQKQLGYIKVEPLRVTRGPVQFAHYSDPSQSKPPTGPVLKLWLRFTNVSTDQLIAPLDAELLLTRSYQIESDIVLANQLLLPADKTSRKPAYVIDHPTTSEWDLAGQKLGHRLAPGESLETYIPLEPGSDAHLTGHLLWRVHFRKGYHDANGHGVTTMIEVPFSVADIQPEPATS